MIINFSFFHSINQDLILMTNWLPTGTVKDDYSSSYSETSPSNDYSFQRHRQRPRYFHGSPFTPFTPFVTQNRNWFHCIHPSIRHGSHPPPKKPLPLLRLVDQSNLWSGDHRERRPLAPETSSASSLVRAPKVKNAALLDHSIAVWENPPPVLPPTAKYFNQSPHQQSSIIAADYHSLNRYYYHNYD